MILPRTGTLNGAVIRRLAGVLQSRRREGTAGPGRPDGGRQRPARAQSHQRASRGHDGRTIVERTDGGEEARRQERWWRDNHRRELFGCQSPVTWSRVYYITADLIRANRANRCKPNASFESSSRLLSSPHIASSSASSSSSSPSSPHLRPQLLSLQSHSQHLPSLPLSFSLFARFLSTLLSIRVRDEVFNVPLLLLPPPLLPLL